MKKNSYRLSIATMYSLLLLLVIYLLISPISALAEENEPHPTAIYINGNLLVQNEHYDPEAFIIYESYLSALPEGINSFEFHFSDGTTIREQFTIDKTAPDGIGFEYVMDSDAATDNESSTSDQERHIPYFLIGFVVVALLFIVAIFIIISIKQKKAEADS